MVDVSKLQFYSGFPIDKIVASGTVTYTIASGTPQSLSPYPNSLQTISNPYGAKALVIGSWSIDGTNFYSSLDQITYYSSTFMEIVLKASVNIGCDANSIYFWINNNFTSSLTFTINYAEYAIS